MSAGVRVGFVGAGRVARILLAGWTRAAAVPADVVAYDPDPAVLDRLVAQAPTVRVGSLAEAGAADVVVVAVHPPVAREAFADLAAALAPSAAVVSAVPTLRLSALAEILGADHAAARVIPNAPSVVGAGYNPVAFAPGAPEPVRAAVRDLLAPLGAAPEVDDEALEAYAVLTAMGPTYLWPQLYALLDVARDAGLDEAAALRGLEAMVVGAAAVMTGSGLDRDAVTDLVPSRPMAAPVDALARAYGEVLTPLHARLAGRAPQPA